MTYAHLIQGKSAEQIEELNMRLDGRTDREIQAKSNVRALRNLPIGQVN